VTGIESVSQMTVVTRLQLLNTSWIGIGRSNGIQARLKVCVIDLGRGDSV